jgi:uncharacterized protein (DUF1697 family)
VADHAAFLKGINLGKRRVTSDDLRAHFRTIGLHEPAVFRASGNVVFEAPTGSSEARLVKLIESELQRLLGYEVRAFVRDRAELLAIAAVEPFDAASSRRLGGKHQIALLAERPVAKARRQALELAGRDDALAFGPRELHWLPAGGVSDTKLDLKELERLLGPMTIRTRGTIEQIAAKHFAS